MAITQSICSPDSFLTPSIKSNAPPLLLHKECKQWEESFHEKQAKLNIFSNIKRERTNVIINKKKILKKNQPKPNPFLKK